MAKRKELRLKEAHGDLKPGTLVQEIGFHILGRESREEIIRMNWGQIPDRDKQAICYTPHGYKIILRTQLEYV